MRAVVHDAYGPPEVLRIEEVERPSPAPDEVLVRVHATTVNRTDCGFRQPRPFFVRAFSGLRRPKHRILGTELAGLVEAVGAAVTQFTPGERVFGVNATRFGAHAEYVCLSETAPLAPMPDGVTFEEAAAVCDGVVLALTYLRRVDARSGQHICIYGASGSIGTAAVQLAKHYGCHVTAVCGTEAVGLVRSLGADEVVDYTRETVPMRGATFDVVLDAVGKTSFRRWRSALAAEGVYLSTDLGFGWQNPFLVPATRFAHKKVLFPLPRYTKHDVVYLKGLMQAGAYRAVIDRTYTLDQVVEATRYVESQQKVGNVVLRLVPVPAP